MKRVILVAIFALASIGFASAQKYCVIDSEKVFKSLKEYNQAMTQLDELGKAYQNEVDNKYKSIESLYNSYMQQRDALSATTRSTIEQQILQKEQEAQSYQQEVLGENGALMKKRLELIKPIQERVFAAIEAYAKANGFELVLDKASNASILYSGSAVDHTEEIIKTLK